MAAQVRTHTADDTAAPARGLGPDFVLLVVVALILTIGIVMLTSAGYILASGKFGDGFYYTKKQVLAMVIGLCVMYVFSLIQPSYWKRLAPHLLLAGIGLLLLVFAPGVGAEMGGSHRWIHLPFGYHLQPSEFVKFALVIFLATSLEKKGTRITEFSAGFLPHVVVLALIVFLVLMQPDFGTAVIIAVAGFLMLFVSGVRYRHLIATLILAVPFLFHVAISAQYRVSRIKTFLDPWSDPLNAGFQVIQSLVAFGCGGVWGVGVGKGIQKLYYLPQPHTDFVFSVVAEELGLVGVVTVILLFYLLVCRGLVVAIRSKDLYHQLLAFGITCLIGLQATVNMAVAMGMLPTKGLPLPLVSLGGTSMITNLAGLGILMAVSRTNDSPRAEAAS